MEKENNTISLDDLENITENEKSDNVNLNTNLNEIEENCLSEDTTKYFENTKAVTAITVTSIFNTDEQFFLCDCGAEGLLVQHDDDDKLMFLSMYTYGQHTNNSGFWKRLKYCWHHLRTGKIYKDELVFSYKKANKFAKYIIKKTDEKL